MELVAWGATDVGLRRKSNQDSFIIRDDLGLYSVADGMGGHMGGEVASQLAIEVLVSEITSASHSSESSQALIQRAYSTASAKIYERGSFEQTDLQGMGTTLVTLWLRGDTLFIANVGDSRAYLATDAGFWQVTEDHSLVNEQLRSGLITEQQARYFSGKNIITRSVGFERDVRVDVLSRRPKKGETYLLCSDGLSGLVESRELASILRQTSGEKAVSQCIKKAKDVGGDDNITVVVVQVV